MQVAFIFGIMGACRSNELHAMVTNDFEDLGTAVLITVPKTKTKIVRKFTVTENYYKIYKKYVNLRPQNCKSSAFFLNYQKGKCTIQRIGINKFGGMGKEIAKFLQIPDFEAYTGHSFRRTSATILVDAGANMTTLKRHGGWKSSSVAEGYIDESMRNKMDTANKIYQSVEHTAVYPCTSASLRSSENIIVEPDKFVQQAASNRCTSETLTNSEKRTVESMESHVENSRINATLSTFIQKSTNELPGLNLSNCSNFTINFYTNKVDK